MSFDPQLFADNTSKILQDERNWNHREHVGIIRAAGTMLKEVHERIDQIDGTHLLKSVASSLITGGLASLESHADAITLKRSKAVAGTPSAIIREALS